MQESALGIGQGTQADETEDRGGRDHPDLAEVRHQRREPAPPSRASKRAGDFLRIEGRPFVSEGDPSFRGDDDERGVMDDGTVITQGLDPVMTHQVLDLAGVAGEEAMAGMVDAITVCISTQPGRECRSPDRK
jgi:hypothetical protein